jgi:hypothetical protein
VDDYNDVILTCGSPLDIVKAKNLLNARLPLEIRSKLNEILIFYLHRYGPDGAFDRMNNRTIGKIITEFELGGGMKPIVSGERDGVRFQLFESSERGAEKGSEGREKPAMMVLGREGT